MLRLAARALRGGLRALLYSSLGAGAVLVAVFIAYLESRPDLEIWHLAELDEEYTTNSGTSSFADYLALEERLFRQLDVVVYGQVPPQQRYEINRYNPGSLSDPQRWAPNWNRTYELSAAAPRAAVLLLHGMSDSPYSLRQLGQRLNAAGAHVVGLRLPGHGTAPTGLVEVSAADMIAATRLALRHLAQVKGDKPLYVVGYSTGAALAVEHVLASLDDPSLPKIDRLVALSPAIGVSPVAALAVWQARLGHLLGLDKLAWNAILPEYDPFKYGSFAVNAGDVVYRLTSRIQERLAALRASGRPTRFPPILAFSSVVDATVSTPALVSGLFAHLPDGGHELVLFDINRVAEIEPILRSDPGAVAEALRRQAGRQYTLSLVTNESPTSRAVVVRTARPGDAGATEVPIGLAWPEALYSLSHVALPFPPHDELYGGKPRSGTSGRQLHIGAIALRGERGVLQISASDMLRLRWNPFYPYVETRVLQFLDLADAAPAAAP